MCIANEKFYVFNMIINLSIWRSQFMAHVYIKRYY